MWMAGWDPRNHRSLGKLRIKDVIDFGFSQRLKTMEAQGLQLKTEDIVIGFWADVSSSITRNPYRHGCPGTFRQNSVAYSYQYDTIVSGAAQLEIMGWPRFALPAHINDGQFRTLSGECYSLPICLALNYVLYANPYGTWWQSPSAM